MLHMRFLSKLQKLITTNLVIAFMAEYNISLREKLTQISSEKLIIPLWVESPRDIHLTSCIY